MPAKQPSTTQKKPRNRRMFVLCCESDDGIEIVPGFRRYATRKAAEYALGALDHAMQVSKQTGHGGYRDDFYEFLVCDLREHAELLH